MVWLFHRTPWLTVIMLAVVGLTACSDDVGVTEPDPPPALAVAVNPSAVTLTAGETVDLDVSVTGGDPDQPPSLSCTSSTPATATATAGDGVCSIEGVDAGEATITVSVERGAQSATNTADVSVNPRPNPMGEVGAEHNALLSCLREEDPRGEADPFRLMVESCGFDPPGGSVEAFTEAYRPYTRDLPDWIDWLISSPFNPYEAQLPAGGTDLIEAVWPVLAALDTTDPDVDEAREALRELEAQAVAQYGESESDGAKAVLAGMSIARASLDYWVDHQPPVPMASGPKWWQVVAADVAGGVVGGIFGGGVGAVGLGTAASKYVGDLADGEEGGMAGNPMGEVGAEHNALLACLRHEDPNGQEDPLRLLVNSCGFDPGMDPDRFVREFGALLPGTLYPDWLLPWPSPFNPYEDRFTPTQMDVLDEVGLIFGRLEGTEPEGEEGSTVRVEGPAIDRAHTALRFLEGRAVADLDRGETDMAVLAGLSIARSSLEFWQDNASPTPKAAGGPKWWQVGLADVAGGVVGGIFGGGVGAVGLGTAASKYVGDLANGDDGGGG